ncbi:MAG: hypothetical protein HY744_16380 [Deltaproteobacteria bacterium]|nr:hypothetical protein [Deltaproteobacteria bacterium]
MSAGAPGRPQCTMNVAARRTGPGARLQEGAVDSHVQPQLQRRGEDGADQVRVRGLGNRAAIARLERLLAALPLAGLLLAAAACSVKPAPSEGPAGPAMPSLPVAPPGATGADFAPPAPLPAPPPTDPSGDNSDPFEPPPGTTPPGTSAAPTAGPSTLPSGAPPAPTPTAPTEVPL